MSAHLSGMYKTLMEAVRKAARYLSLGDNIKSREAIEELEVMSTGFGLTDKEVQFPVEELLQEDLKTKIPGMKEEGNTREVLRYITETTDEEGNTEVHLEKWRVAREEQVKIGYIGQLFSVRIRWGTELIRINVLAAREEFVSGEYSLATVETGSGLAYLVNQFDWATFRIFANEQEDDVSAGVRLIYMCVLDRVFYDHVDVDIFAQWSVDKLKEVMNVHQAGQRFPRFNAQQAGLVVLDRDYKEEEEMEEEEMEKLLQTTPKRSKPEMDDPEILRESTGSTSSTKSGIHLEESKIDEETGEEDGKKEERGAHNNNNEEEKMEEEHVFDSEDATGKKVVMTAHQMRMVLKLLIEEVSPEKSANEVHEAAMKVDLGEIARKTNAGIRRMRRIEEQGHEVDEAIGNKEGNDEPVGKEMWQSEDEDDEEMEDQMFEISGISSLPNLTVSSQSAASMDEEEKEWSPIRRLRNLECSDEPEAKRLRRLNISDESEGSINGSLRDSVLLSPELVKINDGRPVINVSTSSGTPDTPPGIELSPESIARGEYLRMFLESQREARRIMESIPYIREDDARMTEEDIGDISDIVGEFSFP